MAALSHHTMPLEYNPCRCCLTSPHQNRPHLSHSNLCKPPASPERTSPFLIATFPALTAIPHLSRPFHTSSRRCTLPALPFRSLTCRSRPIRSSANLPNQASPNETSPDLDCHTPSFRASYCPSNPLHTSCQTISHPVKPHLCYPLNSSTASSYLTGPKTSTHCPSMTAMPNHTRLNRSHPDRSPTAKPQRISPHRT
jgi:hypothetical protein